MTSNPLVADLGDPQLRRPESRVKRLQRFTYKLLNHHVFGLYWDLGQAALALFGFSLYCAETYLTTPFPLWMLVVEIILTVLYTADLVFYFAAAERKVLFLTSWHTAVDLLSILPVTTLPSLYADDNGPSLQFLRILRLFRAFRLLDVTSTGGLSDAAIIRQVAVLLCTISTYILTGAGMVFAFERLWPGSFVDVVTSSSCDYAALYNIVPYERSSHCTLDLVAAVYFSLITSLTVGFGDIVPTSTGSRILTLAILLPLFLLVPSEASRLLSLLELSSRYNKRFSGSSRGFCVVTGEFSACKMLAFLEEFYHEDHGEQHMRVVFLHPAEPDAAQKAVLNDTRFSQKVQYVRGTPLSAQDLHRVEFFQAHAVFVLSSNGTDPQHADDVALLTAKSLKSTAPWVPLHLTLQLPSSSIHRWADWDHLVCAQEIVDGLLSKSAAVPGLCTLIGNLLLSTSESLRRELGSLDSADRSWMKEYVRGMDNELYCVDISKAFHRQFFNCVVHQAFVMFGVVILGVETHRSQYKADVKKPRPAAGSADEDVDLLAEHEAFDFGMVDSHLPGDAAVAPPTLVGQDGSPEERYQRLQEEKAAEADRLVLLNPRDYLIRAGDKAFVIAPNAEMAGKVSVFNGVLPSHLEDLATVTTADKRTFGRLNGGQGPLIQYASLGAAPAGFSIPPTLDDESHCGRPYVLPDEDVVIDDEVADDTAQATQPQVSTSAASAAPVGRTPEDLDSGVRSDFRVDPNPLELQARVVASAAQLTGHTIVCGPGVSTRLHGLASSLASTTSSNVVALYPFQGSEEEETAALMKSGLSPDTLRRIFLINGVSSSDRDLIRAGIATAACAMIVSSTISIGSDVGLSQGLNSDPASSVIEKNDIDALFTACVIESRFPHTRILVDVPHSGALRYLSSRPYLSDNLPGSLWPQLASGRVFVSSVVSVLQVNCFYMPSLLTLIGKLFDPSCVLSSGTKATPPAVGSSLAVACAARFQPVTGIEDAATALELARKFPEHNRLHHMLVPEPYIGRRFGDLFVELILSRSILCIGVYRSSLVHGAPLPYVITNPSPKLRLHREDKLYVLVGPVKEVITL